MLARLIAKHVAATLADPLAKRNARFATRCAASCKQSALISSDRRVARRTTISGSSRRSALRPGGPASEERSARRHVARIGRVCDFGKAERIGFGGTRIGPSTGPAGGAGPGPAARPFWSGAMGASGTAPERRLCARVRG